MKHSRYTFLKVMFIFVGLLLFISSTTMRVKADEKPAEPVFTLSATAKGATLKWNAVPGAEFYRVYRRTYSGSYEVLGDTTGTNYTDTTADTESTYYYTVQAGKTVSGKEILSSCHSGHIRLGCPESAAENYTAGVKVTWDAIEGAEKYRVYRKTDSSDWTKLEETTSLSYTDKTAVSGTVYHYTVRAIDPDRVFGWFVNGCTIARLSRPEVTLSPTVKGATVKWDAIPGAEFYRVYRRTYSGDYKKIADVTATAYTDTTAESDETYYYTVRAAKKVNGKNHLSAFHSGHIRLACPEANTENYKAGVKITWKAVEGAKEYRIYRKTASTAWAKLDETTSLSYTDKTAVSGTVYSYTVRAIDANRTFGWFVNGSTIARLSRPEVTLSPTVKGASMQWDAIPGAEFYRVYRRTYTGSYSRIADITATNYTDTTADPNTTYYYTVRAAMKVSGKDHLSAFHSGHIRLASPTAAADNVSSGVKITWPKVEGAAEYRIYRKTPGTNWAKLAETSSLSYTDKTVENGKTYSYTVRAIDPDRVFGWFVNGDTVTHVSAPVFSAGHSLKGTKITWKAISGATKYRVYRKTGNGSYSKLADVTGTSYVDTTGIVGTEYGYTVRAVIGDAWSGYRSADFVEFSIPFIIDSDQAGSGTSKKGIQCGQAYEATDFNAENVYLHLNVADLIYEGSGENTLYTYNGTSYVYYGSRANSLGYYAKEFKNYYGGKTVTVVFVSSKKIPGLTYTPEANAAYYGLNVTDATCKKNVQALLNKIADAMGDSVDNWVVGNEIDCPVTYNNCGSLAYDKYVQNYYDLLSMVHKTMQKKNNAVCTMVPIDQGWVHGWRGDDPTHFPSRQILLDIAAKSSSNDFNWGVALHPYPVDLKNSNWWDDPKNYPQAITFGEDTDMYSMANIEVITSYIANHLKYNGKCRYIAITEVGFNAAVNGTLKLDQQAASLAYAYYKAEADPNIKLFIYNAMRDNWDPMYKFGLQDEDYTNRPSFYSFYFMDTPTGTDVTKPYLKILGASSWNSLVPSLDTAKFQRKVTVTHSEQEDAVYYVRLGNYTKYTGFVKFNGKVYYCSFGEIHTDFTGTATVFEVTYDIVNGVLQLS